MVKTKSLNVTILSFHHPVKKVNLFTTRWKPSHWKWEDILSPTSEKVNLFTYWWIGKHSKEYPTGNVDFESRCTNFLGNLKIISWNFRKSVRTYKLTEISGSMYVYVETNEKVSKLVRTYKLTGRRKLTLTYTLWLEKGGGWRMSLICGKIDQSLEHINFPSCGWFQF